jgi:thymidylate synthase
MILNKYFSLLNKILDFGAVQENKKGTSIALINQVLDFSKVELLELFSTYTIPKEKLKAELDLYLQGEENISEYNAQGIQWWNYIGEKFEFSYPQFFGKLPLLISKVNQELSNSKNYVLFCGETLSKTNQLPCISLIQFQVNNGVLNITVYQRSADCNLGLPCDLYQVYLISNMFMVPLSTVTFFIGNAHIYFNNIQQTKNMLLGESYKFILNV